MLIYFSSLTVGILLTDKDTSSFIYNTLLIPKQEFQKVTEARWHIGMSSASHWEDLGTKPGKGQFFRIMFELLCCSYSHILVNNFY